ncbi:MAG: PEP-CTERM sorting domain-containing protein [Candidatus Accumulibacter sp.]|uniref:PEP-CTERM sorting domain-containing protein n=1 Tax=Candidatus Accumulibacter proximus TaxID=2954385 RepID=A0A935PXZ9_9PROT|nr:PEP-CTERM sorting domain-containing protein [Candidatus Accumulibacter proximus]
MRTLLSILALFSASLPAFGIDPITPVPEPESLSLLGVAAAAMLVALRRKK